MNRQHHSPPRLAQRLLLSFLRDDLAEEVTGDLDEKFCSMLQKTTPHKARLNYWFQVIKYIRPFAFRKSHSVTSNHYDMFRNYFKIAWRNMSRQKMYSAIKVGGFALGIAACFLITLFIKDELSYDKHYPNVDRIYRVLKEFEEDGKQGRGAAMQAPFAKTIQKEFPEIALTGRLMPYPTFGGAGSNQVRRTDVTENTFEEGFSFADQEILDILGIPLVYGDRSKALAEPFSMVISKRMADKYFPNENPVGKTMILNNAQNRIYTVGGVMENFPRNMHIQYDFFLTLAGVEFWPGEQNFWRANNYQVYALLKPGTDAKKLADKLTIIDKKYTIPSFVGAGIKINLADIEKMKYQLQPITRIHLYSQGVDDRLSHGDIRFTWLFGAVAIFILIIASINFVNLATARSANRAKEVGLRKVVGSLRGNLVRQFLVESTLISLLSFVLGMLVAALLLPWFNTISAKSLSFPWTAWWLLPLLTGSALVVGLLAGIYPAFYLSSFRPIHVLKGNISRGSKSSFTRNALVVFQFATSIVLIAGTFIIYRQMNYIMHRKIGFEKDQVLMLQGSNTLGDKLPAFKNELQKIPGIKYVTASDYLPVAGTRRNGMGFFVEGKEQVDEPVYRQFWRVDPGYIKTLGMKIVEGRDFDENNTADSQAVIISRELARSLRLKNPIGARIVTNNVWTVIGVIEDFHAENLKEKVQGVCLALGRGSPAIVSAKVNTTSMPEVIGSVNSLWKRFSPDQTMRFTFLDERFATMYDDVQRSGRIFTSFAILAIVIACLGLFALSAYMVQQRNKEISIRLVLGASTQSIFRLLTQNFMLLVFISLLIATPIAWILMHNWLQDFVYRIEIGWDVFLFTALIAVAIALFTISHQAIRAALTDPVKNLRSE